MGGGGMNNLQMGFRFGGGGGGGGGRGFGLPYLDVCVGGGGGAQKVSYSRFSIL